MQTAATSLKEKLVSQAIRDPLFTDALQDAADEIVQLSHAAGNEATVESAFERVLYAVLKDIGIPFHPQKETPIKTRRHIAKGRTDSRIGGVVIEYKQPSTLKSDKQRASAIDQLTGYLESLSEEVNNEAIGFVTDGTQVLELRVQPDGLTTASAFHSLEGRSLSRIVTCIVSLEHSALSAENLVKDFCDKSGVGSIFDLARGLYRTLRDRATAKTTMLQAEWEAMFRLAHDDTSQQKRIEDRRAALASLFRIKVDSAETEYRALFALDTAYAIVLKMIAYRVVSDIKFNHVIMEYKALVGSSNDIIQSFAATLEDGELFRQVGLLNLLEGDFFSWYCDANQWDDFAANSIRQVLTVLARYEDTRSIFTSDNAVDLFRTLYEATVPQAVRSSLGEFYTPYWLADHVIETSGFGHAGKILDPCCGSGTFLIAAIARIRARRSDKSNHDLATEILAQVTGIDLNPLAVLTARIQYFIHISDLLDNFDETIVIPVFLGDASNTPKRVQRGSVEFISYELKTLKTPIRVEIPERMTRNIAEFIILMNAYEALIKEGDYDEATSLLMEAGEADAQPEVVRTALAQLSGDIVSLERREWNGIWARIIANFVAIASIGKFSAIVGNPPWVDWKSLPSGYREKIKGLCVDKGLFSGAARTGGVNLNVCALIAHVAATNWLDDKGRMALLMPRELANQASYEGWRRSVGGLSCGLVSLDDWTNAGHPFEPVREDFMTFIFEGGRSTPAILPVRSYRKVSRGERPHQWKTLAQALEHLEVNPRVAGQIVDGKTSYTLADSAVHLRKLERVAGACFYKGREGVEFYPQELLLFRFAGAGPTAGTAWMKNIQIGRSKYKIPEQRVLLETEYMFPLVKGPGIERFFYDDPDIYVVFPYEASNPKMPVSRNVLRKKCPKLYAYLLKYKDIIEKQSHFKGAIPDGSAFYGLARIGPYSFVDRYVAFRDNSKWRATVITTKQTPWGESKRYLFQNHAVSMCECEDGSIMSLKEVHFVAGIFNTKTVEEFVYASSDNRSFKIRPPVFVPKFDKNNSAHIEIAQISQKLHQSPDKFAVYAAKLDNLYLSICPKLKG